MAPFCNSKARTPTRIPDAVVNYRHFCLAAVTVIRIYAAHLKWPPICRFTLENTTDQACTDLRRLLARYIAREVLLFTMVSTKSD